MKKAVVGVSPTPPLLCIGVVFGAFGVTDCEQIMVAGA